MPSFIPSGDVIETWLMSTVYGKLILQIIGAIILLSLAAAGRKFLAYIKDRRANRLEVLESRRANRLEVLERRLKYFQTMKERPAKHFATLNVYGFLFLTFLVIRVSSSDLELSDSQAFFVSIIMFSAFVIFAKTGFLLMNLDYFIERMQRKITEFKEPDEEF